jgi:hypothetical protein
LRAVALDFHFKMIRQDSLGPKFFLGSAY